MTSKKITVSLIKALREHTGAGILDCKKALIKENGDFQLAVERMRKFGLIIATKKNSNATFNGIVISKIGGHYAMIIEINCQTDFVAKNSIFQNFATKVINAAVIDKITDVKVLRSIFEEERSILVTKTGENINISRVATIEGEMISSYQHGLRIGVLIAATGTNINKKLLKQLAMHIAASKPEFIKPENVPSELIKKETQIQLAIAMQNGKPKEIADKIVGGRIKKFINEISLTSQQFIMDSSKSVAHLLKEHNIDITDFIRFEVGENLNNDVMKPQ